MLRKITFSPITSHCHPWLSKQRHIHTCYDVMRSWFERFVQNNLGRSTTLPAIKFKESKHDSIQVPGRLTNPGSERLHNQILSISLIFFITIQIFMIMTGMIYYPPTCDWLACLANTKYYYWPLSQYSKIKWIQSSYTLTF